MGLNEITKTRIRFLSEIKSQKTNTHDKKIKKKRDKKLKDRDKGGL